MQFFPLAELADQLIESPTEFTSLSWAGDRQFGYGVTLGYTGHHFGNPMYRVDHSSGKKELMRADNTTPPKPAAKATR